MELIQHQAKITREKGCKTLYEAYFDILKTFQNIVLL